MFGTGPGILWCTPTPTGEHAALLAVPIAPGADPRSRRLSSVAVRPVPT
ncbi:hypothetical protein HBB16_04225 [Pseudonocardia sp. MCCB 268]|nr:hypothetical protein [Pseudonocardia cytotoxica]